MPRTLTALAVLAALTLLVAACEEDPAVDEPEEPEEAEEAEEPAADELDLLEEGQLTVGSDLAFAPFEFIEDDEPAGFDIDLMDAIADELGVDTEYVDADFDGILTQLAAGEFDVVISALTITEERQETVDFSDPYFEATQALVTLEGSDIASEDDLEGLSIGAQAGTTGLDYAEEAYGEDNEIVEFPGYPEAFADLEGEGIDVVIADLPAADEEVGDSETLVIADEVDTGEEYGIAVDPTKPELLEAVDAALAAVIADGTYAEIYQEWFPELEVPEAFAGDDA